MIHWVAGLIISLGLYRDLHDQASKLPTVLFSIYQNNTWNIRRLVNETIGPATQHILLKIVGFLVTLMQKSTLNWYSITKVMLQYILRGVCRLNNRPYRVHHPLWNYYTIKMSMSGIINNAFEVNQQTSKCGSAMQFSTPNELSWQHNYLPGHKIYILGQ